MAKKLYSLMLNDRVVAAVDNETHRLGTNRSALIDSVLAEYFGVPTTQKMVSNIYSATLCSEVMISLSYK